MPTVPGTFLLIEWVPGTRGADIKYRMCAEEPEDEG
jgi:hypothetical protein